MGRMVDLEALLAAGKFRTTFKILKYAIILQLLCSVWPNLTDWLAFQPALGIWSVAGLLTHMFAHASWDHLIGNFSFGLPFMLYLESRLGSRRMLEFYVLCGLFAAAYMLILSGPSACIGSSGAVFGCAAGACMLWGQDAKEHCLGIAGITMLLLPQLYMGPYATMTGIAYYAHVGGAIGAIMLTSRLYRGKR